MIIAQLTDLHVLPAGERLDGVDTNAMLRSAIAHLNALVPAPDVVVISGDLVEKGNCAAYDELRRILGGLRLPWYLAVGNHDCRRSLVECLGADSYLPFTGFVHYAVDTFPVRLVAADTLFEGRGGGQLCPARLAWLDRTLAARPEAPTLIFMHHPPFDSGIAWMDAGGFEGAAEFEALARRHPQVKRIVCGHLHRPIDSVVGGIHVSVAPSTCYQVHLDLSPAASPHIIMEPPACHLHRWDGTRFVTHVSYIAPTCAPIDLGKTAPQV